MEPFFHAETQKKAETKYDQIFLFSAEKAKKLETKKTGFEKNLEVKLFYSSKADANQKRKKVSINKQTKKCRSAMFHIFICCLFFNLPDVIKTYNSCGEEKNSRTGLLFYFIFLFQNFFRTTCFLENGLSGSNGCLVTKSSLVCIHLSSYVPKLKLAMLICSVLAFL